MEEYFEAYSNVPIAIYGLGIETKKALAELENSYEIVGLLDSFNENGELYSKPIISFANAISKGVKLIVVVARPGSCKAISKKIGDLCKENQIALMDIRGNDLLVTNKITYNLLYFTGTTKAELVNKIHQVDAVSFDLFDTLVMRQTLYTDDVIRYLECNLREKGIWIEDFYRKRLSSEKELSKEYAPTLVDIYENVLRKSDDATKNTLTATKLAEWEWNTDFELLIPRKDVCDIFYEAVKCGKHVYIISDTYYNRTQIEQILQKCGITEYTDILVSSDYRTGKTQQLYSVLKDKERGQKCFHIGDDVVADIESATAWGIESCQIFSGLELFNMVGDFGLTDDDTLLEHLRLGMFVAKIFNSPFQFETKEKNLKVTNAYDVGYLFCSPIIIDFVFWFYQQITEQNIKNIWFCARDGYLIKKMYAYLLKLHNEKDNSIYFLTSRTAAIRAGVQNERDIEYVEEMKFSGTLEENLKKRFGIESGTVGKCDICSEKSGLLKYEKIILNNAVVARENYKKYIENLDIQNGDIAFFDFVAKGTSQLYMQKLVPNHMKGLYFLQLEVENMADKGLDIVSFYSDKEKDTSAIFDNYYILETLLTAPHSSVHGFNEKGEPILATETRSEENINCFQRAQEGILDYFRLYLKLCPGTVQKVNKKLDEKFLKLLHKIKIIDKTFTNLVVEDPFFNRMTNITDIL